MINIRKIISVLITASICASNVAAFAEVPDKQTVQEYFASKNEDERETSEIIVSYSDEIQTSDMSRSAKIVNAEVEKVISENTVLLKTDDIEGTLETLKENESVVYAQPNYRLYTASDDMLNYKLWAMENKGQIINGTQGSENADLNILKAWEITKGSEEVVVAVLDTGIDINHPALSGNIWTNSNEQTNGADSDNNGYADDVNGWDFVNNDSSVFDNAAVDGHGTHMAGIIAANGQNGVYGVAPNVKIMPLKVMEANSGYTSDIIEAIEYAETNGAKIVNCSFAGLEYNPALEDAISKSSMLFVTAAGNYSSSTDDLVAFPACYDCKNIISVGAVDNNGNIAELSSYGDLINVYAPGTGIYSTLPDNEYDFMNGTSCSAAYVTGIAALLYSEYPELTVKQAKEAICSKSGSSESGIQLMNTSAEMLDAKEILDFDILNAKSSMPEIIDLSDDITEREEKYPFSFFDESGVKFSLNVTGISDGSLSISAADNEYAEGIFYIEISDDNRYVDIQNIANDTEYDFWLTYTQDNIRHNYYGKLKKSYIEDENKYLTESYGIVANNYEIGIALLSNVEERESNDTMQFADTINSDDDVYGAISSLSDVDWYKITFSSSGVANFWLGDVPSDCNYQLELYNASGSRLTGSYNAAGKQELISFYSVSASTYYIKIYSANGYSSSIYRFRAKWYPLPDSYESNDSFASSSTLGNNSYKYANINHPDDVDFYKFTLTQKSYVELKLSNIPSGSRYNMEIYNGAGKNYFMSGNYTSGTSKQFLQILESGTYYVKIYSYDGAYSEDEYKIFLNSGIAYSMSLSGNTSGSIGTSVIAAYTFSAPSKRGVKIYLSGVSSSDFDLFLYELSSGTLTKIASGESDSKTDESVSATLPGGDYVLIVKRCNGSETSFTLSALQTTTSKQAEITLSGFPTTMNTGDSKAITVKVTNNGINEWTRADGYKLGGLYDVVSFADSEFLLTSTEKIQYGKSKTFRFNLTAPAISNMQDYTLAFKMKQNGTYFNYVSDHQVINVMANVDSISPGSTKSISGVTAKYYKLTVSSGANYAFRTMYKGTKCDTELYLYDSAMNLIESNDDIYDRKVYKQNYYSKIERYLSSGTYYICVKEHSGSTVQCCLNVDTYAEDNLSASANVTNKYEGYYRYTVSTAGTYVFATKKYAADCDTYLILTDLNGVVLESNNDSGSSVYAKIETELSKGTYYLRVSSYKYIAKGEDAKTNCTLTAGLKSVAPPTGDSASISISSPSAAGVIKTYTGNSIKISGNAANCSGVTVKVNNKTLSGVKLNGSRYEVYYTPTESGKYTILVTGNATFGSNPSASITVTIAVNDDSDNFNSTPTAINSGTERVAAIDYVDDVDCFSFTPKETGSYKIYSSGSVDLKAVLYENDKITSIGTSYNAPESINFKLARTLEKNKTYYIRVDAEKHGVTGKYTINIEKIDEPDDTYFKDQWGLLNRGGFSTSDGKYITKVGYDINVLPVWEYTKGKGITIGVIDSGVYYTHDDLKDNLILPGENMVHKNNDIFPSNEADVYDADGNPINTSAREGHGTHVTGIIGAIGNNDKGITGVAPEAKILPIKSLGNSLVTAEEFRNESSNEVLLNGIEYAVNQNVQIVNMSLQHFEYSDEIRDVINAASDTLFVICAGNDGENLDTADTTYQYPGMYDCSNVITVAAMDYNGDLCDFSNYRGRTQIAAPGELVLSTFPDEKGSYHFEGGTSMAAPHVSGVAALIWSYYKDLTPAQVKQRIISKNNVSYNKKLDGKVNSNGSLNAWYAFSDDSPIPRKTPQITLDTANEIQKNKERIAIIKNSRSNDRKTTKIFVKAIEDNCTEIINEVLSDNNYKIVKRYSLSGIYLLDFPSISEADAAIDKLNACDDIKYATPNYIITIE